MPTIAAYEAKSKFSELLRAVEKGETFIITRNGVRVAEVGPCTPETPLRKRGMMRDAFSKLPEDFNDPLPEFEEYQ